MIRRKIKLAHLLKKKICLYVLKFFGYQCRFSFLPRRTLCLAWPQPEGASPLRLQCRVSAQPRSFLLTLEVDRPPDVVSSVTGVPSGSGFRVVRKGCRPRPAEYRNGPVAAAHVRPPPRPRAQWHGSAALTDMLANPICLPSGGADQSVWRVTLHARGLWLRAPEGRISACLPRAL